MVLGFEFYEMSITIFRPRRPTTEKWRRPRASVAAFDDYINSRLEAHFDDVTQRFDADSRGRFKELPRVGAKAEVVFSLLRGHEATLERAVDVKALSILHHMSNQLRRIDERRDILLPTEERLWEQVDSSIYRHLGTFVMQETAEMIEPFDAVNDVQRICEIRGKQVVRTANAASLMVRYAVK